MSQDNISYIEASSRYPPVRRSYAEMAKEMFTPSHSPSTSTQPPSSPTRSYCQTVIHSPRPRAPLGKGYDKQAHQTIVGNNSSSLPNGCALSNNHNPSHSYNNNLLENLVNTILSIVTTCSDMSIPTNVAQSLTQLYQILKNGPNQLPAVEL
ncbi:unnamed protein product [Euphydryas editha]|uniref:Uncharacterized protein n=1 Tax=Euphydryas editha TaxID=104508 RepID=A0AAU9V6N2_EUPED|nr:unnamed protein product [Euphydryas editha]